MLTKKEEQKFNYPVFAIVYGNPGAGKTTLALSAPRPLLIDLDNGLRRVEYKYRTDVLNENSLDELYKDLSEIDLSNYDSIVIDTGGGLDNLIIDKIKETPTNLQKDGNITLKAYGILKDESVKLVKYILEDLKKHLVLVYHIEQSEIKNSNNETITQTKVLSSGKAKNIFWSMADIGMFVTKFNNKVYCDFSCLESRFTKQTKGLTSSFEITLTEEKPQNDFLTKAFKIVQQNWNADNEEKLIYERQIKFKEKINLCKDENDLLNCRKELASGNFDKTIVVELLHHLKDKEKELKFEWNKDKKVYKPIKEEKVEESKQETKEGVNTEEKVTKELKENVKSVDNGNTN